jgi:hypothetical protein
MPNLSHKRDHYGYDVGDTSFLYMFDYDVKCPKSTGPNCLILGPVEDADLYDNFLITFMQVSSISLREMKARILTDESSDFRAIFTTYQMKHLFCLRHLLVKIKRGAYGFPVANLLP